MDQESGRGRRAPAAGARAHRIAPGSASLGVASLILLLASALPASQAIPDSPARSAAPLDTVPLTTSPLTTSAPDPPAALAPDGETFILPATDPALQAGLDRILADRRFRKLVAAGRLSVALVDLSDPARIRWAGHDVDRMRYAASLPKIAILLGAFDQIEKGRIAYSRDLRERLERMIRSSSNREASNVIKMVGFEAIARTLQDPHYQLYDLEDRGGGLWVGRGYGNGVGLWRRDPLRNLSHGATARQVARFLVMMDRGDLVSPWASAEMKRIMGDPAIHHKFVRGLDQRPGSRIFRKSGTWREWHSDAAIVERDGRRYAAVALLESRTAQGVLSDLIVRLDDLVTAVHPRPKTTQAR